MSVELEIKNRIANLIAAANAKTGNADADLTTAVRALIAGFGQGSSVDGLAYDMGEFTLDSDVNSNNPGSTSASNPVLDGIPHNLGDVPDFICVWSDHWAGITESPYTTATIIGFIWLNRITGMVGRATSTANVTNPMIAMFVIAANDYRLGFSNPSSAAYGLDDNRLPNAETFYTPNSGNATWWRGGVTYKYFVSKAWWEVSE